MPPSEPSKSHLANLTATLLTWYRANRRDLPWRRERDPYRIWVSEIMLQQTQVATAIPYYERFIESFPTLKDLAEADTDQVLRAWEGLGYYSRARNLQTAVREVQERYGGQVPSEVEQLRELKGVGEYTAGAIASIAFNRSEPAVDGNVLRVISRLFAIHDDIGLPPVRKQITALVRQMIPDGDASDFTQALMELGALVCSPTSASCDRCPVIDRCQAYAEGVVAQLPQKRNRTKVTTERLLVFLWLNNGCIAVEQRPKHGLLASQWQLPMRQMEDGELAKVVEAFVRQFTEGDHVENHELGVDRYRFSHRLWQQQIVKLIATPQHQTPFSWLPLAEIPQHPLITAHRRILEQSRLCDVVTF